MSRLVILHLQYKTAFDAISLTPVEIADTDVLYMQDGFDYRIIDLMLQMKSTLPGMLVCDTEVITDTLGIPSVFVPDLYSGPQRYARIFVDRNYPLPDSNTTNACFNFSVNNRKVDRLTVLKLVEWFELTNCQYSWRGDDVNCDMTHIVDEMKTLNRNWLTPEFRNAILSPITKLQPNWVEASVEPVKQGSGATLPWGEKSAWIIAVKDQMSTTAVSVINESTKSLKPGYSFSEKTVFSIMSLTFPIWAGNHGQAEQAQRMGFDVFSDVINHDYQYYPTLLERCYHAFADNLKILTDLDHAQEQRNKCLERLEKNRQHCLNGAFAKYAQQQVKLLPDEIQQQLVLTDGVQFPGDSALSRVTQQNINFI